MMGILGLLPWWMTAPVLFAMVALCVHVVRTHQQMYWLWIIIMVPGLGALVYFIAVVLPELMGGTTARRMGAAALGALDPGRAYREAKAAYDDTPTVQNSMKLAEAACGMDRWAEAEGLYATAARGLYADDPALLLGRAHALVELNRPAEALVSLDQLQTQGGRPPQADLLRARAEHALGHTAAADKAYAVAVERLPGLEALARQAVFLAQTGRKDEAQDLLNEINKRLPKTQAHFRVIARHWRDFAAAGMG
jgi:hypothetical protein